MSATHLCLTILALAPELSASLLSGLFAAVPVLPGATDKQAREAILAGEMNELRPRDLEEAILASQLLVARYNADACFHALEGLDPASKEASRLRRDGMALQRVVLATQRALHRSQARPMQQDAACGEPRPTVPVKLVTPPRGKAASQENPPVLEEQATPDQAAVAAAAEAPAKYDPFKDDPSLERLRQKWHTLKRWEDMTMEERRETFGYSYEPKRPAEANGNGNAAQPATKAGRPAA